MFLKGLPGQPATDIHPCNILNVALCPGILQGFYGDPARIVKAAQPGGQEMCAKHKRIRRNSTDTPWTVTIRPCLFWTCFWKNYWIDWTYRGDVGNHMVEMHMFCRSSGGCPKPLSNVSRAQISKNVMCVLHRFLLLWLKILSEINDRC